MSKKNSQIGKTANASPHDGHPPSIVRPNHVSEAAQTNKPNAFNDIAGVPFLLVDGICATTRHQLHVALFKREEKRMNWVQKQCAVLPWLEYERSATSVEPTTDSGKADTDELNFQDDLKLLTLAVLTVDEEETKSIMPIANFARTAKLVPNVSRIEEIRVQLEQLREQQQNGIVSSVSRAKQINLSRQDTFDINRNEPIQATSSCICLRSHPTSQRLMRAATISQLPIAKSQNICSYKGSTSTLLLTENKPSSLRLSKNLRSPQLPIINQIRNLLKNLQFPHPAQEKRRRSEGSFSYLVTVSPSADCTSCKVQPLPEKSKNPMALPKGTR
ncbi:uncharacterized protein LOC6563223 isoform X2 [Drosophila grimshawi]|nr:uncharacterized protein LOC6563223 isoform X2 [Drosophila grimshawi]